MLSLQMTNKQKQMSWIDLVPKTQENSSALTLNRPHSNPPPPQKIKTLRLLEKQTFIWSWMELFGLNSPSHSHPFWSLSVKADPSAIWQNKQFYGARQTMYCIANLVRLVIHHARLSHHTYIKIRPLPSFVPLKFYAAHKKQVHSISAIWLNI